MKCSPRGKKNRKRSAVNVSFLSIVHSKLNPAFCGTFDNAKNSYVCQLSCSYLMFTSVNGGTGSSAITLTGNIIKTAAKIIFATVFIFVFVENLIRIIITPDENKRKFNPNYHKYTFCFFHVLSQFSSNSFSILHYLQNFSSISP